jgi:hypothetical protein
MGSLPDWNVGQPGHDHPRMFRATVTGWAATLAAIACLIAFDLWQAHRLPHAVGLREAAGGSLF